MRRVFFWLRDKVKLEYGDVTYNPKAIYLYNYDGDNILVEMMGKIEEKGLLTNEELSKLIFSILMKSKESFKKRAIDLFELAKKIKDEDQRNIVAGGVAVLVSKAMNEQYEEDLKEALRMSQIIENYDAELRKEGERQTLLRLVQSHLSRKKSDDYIMDALEISQEELDNLKKTLAEHKKI